MTFTKTFFFLKKKRLEAFYPLILLAQFNLIFDLWAVTL